MAKTCLQSVTFPSRGLRIAARLYTPPVEAANRKQAAIIVGHPVSGVKEQAAGLYARQLADAGFVTLTFDAAYQGDSEGSPRGLEDPYRRVEDFKYAATYLSNLDKDLVDRRRIGVVGICGAGGYVPFAAQTDLRMRAVATVSATCLGDLTRLSLDGGPAVAVVTPSLLAAQLQEAGRRRTARDDERMPTLPEDFADIPVEMPERSMLKEAWSYYKTSRAGHPRAPLLEVAWGVDLRANYDSFHFIHMISPRPWLMIAGGDADTANQSRRAIETAEEPKELFITEGKSHVDLYDDTSKTVPKLIDFMSKALCS